MGQHPATPKVVPTADDASTSLESLLQTKVVTASRFSEDLADAPGVITVVSRDEINRMGGLTLREILSRVAGLDVTSNALTDRSMIAVRGDQAKANGVHVLFLINGRPTREVVDGGAMSELLEAFPIAILERIEVIEGPGSVLYGSNAYSGVINLITRKADGKSGAVRGFGSGVGPAGGSAEGLYRRGDFSLVAAVQFHQNARWTTLVAPDLAPNGTFGPLSDYSLYDGSRGLFVEAGYKGFSAMVSNMAWRSVPVE